MMIVMGQADPSVLVTSAASAFGDVSVLVVAVTGLYLLERVINAGGSHVGPSMSHYDDHVASWNENEQREHLDSGGSHAARYHDSDRGPM